MIFTLLRYLFRPNHCYRKWYNISYNSELINDCKCLIKCKYPSPPGPSQIIYVQPDLEKNLTKNM